MKKNLETVAKIYEAFGKGDVPTILSFLADDVRWEHWADNSAQNAGVPWLKSRKGKDGAMKFFKAVGELNITEFNVISLMAGPNQVSAEISITAEVQSTRRKFRDEEMHLWNFNDAGKVTRFRHYLDTFKHMTAAGVEAVH